MSRNSKTIIGVIIAFLAVAYIAQLIFDVQPNPRFAYEYYSRGYSKGRLENYKGAIADYDKAIELDPQDGRSILQSWLCKREVRKL